MICNYFLYVCVFIFSVFCLAKGFVDDVQLIINYFFYRLCFWYLRILHLTQSHKYFLLYLLEVL